MIVALGDLMVDIVMHSDSPLRVGGHCLAQAQVSAGGSAANFAVWVSRLGADVALMARVGKDLLGEALLRDLEREGVTSAVTVGRETTAMLLALEEGSSGRSILAARGATSCFGLEDIDWALLDRADLLHVTAYSFFEEKPRAAALAAMSHAKKGGSLLSLDPSSSSYLARLGSRDFLAMIREVDILLPNLEEGRVLTSEQAPERVVKELMHRFPVVVLKMGDEGAMAGADGEIRYRPGYPVSAVDTLGAGDAFNAAFVASWLAGEGLDQALDAGNRLASRVVQVPGARAARAVPHESSPGPLSVGQ